MARVLAVVFGLVVCAAMGCYTALEITGHPGAADGIAGVGTVLGMLLAVGTFLVWIVGND